MIDHFAAQAARQAEDQRNREAAEAAFGKSYTRPTGFRGEGRNRPICPYCHKPFGVRTIQRSEWRLAIGDSVPGYNGPDHLICQSLSVGPGMGPDGKTGAWYQRETWDGTSYHSSSLPFCTTSCAYLFGKRAYEAGYRMVPNKQDAAA